MVRMIGVEVVGQQRAVGGIHGMQVARPLHRLRKALGQHHAEIVDEDRLAAVGELQARGADFAEGEFRLSVRPRSGLRRSRKMTRAQFMAAPIKMGRGFFRQKNGGQKNEEVGI